MRKMRKHRVAVVGCGAIAQGFHLPNIQRNPRLELIAACDINSELAKDACERFNAQRFTTDWKEIIDAPDIDIIVLATHTSLRGALIIPALKNRKPVYTEKPLSPSKEEISGILKVFRRTGVPVCVGHNRRSGPAVLEFKRLLDKAKSGIPAARPSIDRQIKLKSLPWANQLQLLIRINDDARSWKDWVFKDKEGIMFAEMVHFIDLALWFNSSYPARIFAEGPRHGNFTLIMKFKNGSLTTLQHTMAGNFDYPKELFEATINNITIAMDNHMEVRQLGIADEPVLKTFPYTNGCEWAKEEGMSGYMRCVEEEQKRANLKGESPRFLNVNKGHYEHFNRFLDHIEGNGENPCDLEGAAAVNLLTMKFLESSDSGMPIVIEDWREEL